VLFGMIRQVIGSPGAVKPAFGTYASGYIQMFGNKQPSNIANPQSPPDSAVHPNPKLPEGLVRRPGPIRIW
jgi:hypothetical protein